MGLVIAIIACIAFDTLVADGGEIVSLPAIIYIWEALCAVGRYK